MNSRWNEVYSLLLTHESFEKLGEDAEGRQMIIDAVPETEVMFGYDQHSPYHDYDLWVHTAKTIDGIPGDLPQSLYEDLRIAAFFHDIGKPDTARIRSRLNEKLRLSFPGHAERSVVIAEPYLRRIIHEDGRVYRILFYISSHDLFIDLREDSAENAEEFLSAGNIQHLMEYFRKGHTQYSCRAVDFYRMLWLSQSDAAAHAAVVYRSDGSVKDTRESLTERVELIRQAIYEDLLTDTEH